MRPLKSSGFSAIYSAAGNTIPCGDIEDAGILNCEGVLLDVLDGLGTYSSENDDDIPGYQSKTKSRILLTNAANGDRDLSPTDHAVDLITTICRCLVLNRKDRYLCHAAPMDQYVRDFQAFCSTALLNPSRVHKTFGDWFLANKSLEIRGLSLEALTIQTEHAIPDSNVDLNNRDDWESFLARFRDTTVSMARRLSTTIKGYIAMAPAAAEPGDIICVLYGCSVPVVLRPRVEASTYEFIGECYVDGFMNGEILAKTDGEIPRPQNFQIS